MNSPIPIGYFLFNSQSTWGDFMSKIKKNRASLKRRIMRTFSLLNLVSLLVLLVTVATAIGFSFHAFTAMLSSSVAERMAMAISRDANMDLKGLGGPYLLSKELVEEVHAQTMPSGETPPQDQLNTQTPPPVSLIYYRVFEAGKVKYDSLNKTDAQRQSYDQLRMFTLMQQINVKSEYDYTDASGNKKGTVEVELNPLLVYVAFWILIVLTIVGFLLVLTLTQIAVRLFTPVLVKPILELEKKMAVMANGDIETALETTIFFKKPVLEVEQLSSHANKIISQMNTYIADLEDKSQIVENQRDAIQTIFQQVDQGIFRIDEDHIIQEACSAECERLLGVTVPGRKIEELFYPESEGEQKFFNELLTKVFNTTGLEKDVYLSLLPEQLHLNEHWINIGYKPMKSSNEKRFLMVVLTDQTEKRILEQQMAMEQKTLKMVVKSMIHSEELKQILSAFYEFVSQAEMYDQNNEMDYLLREVHTFKGNFSQYDWLNIVDYLETLEDGIIHKSQSYKEQLKASELLTCLEMDLRIIRQHAGMDFLKESSQCIVERDKILKVESRIRELLSQEEAREILPLVREMRYTSVFQMLGHYKDYVQKLSERLEKYVNPLIITGDDVRLDPDYYSDVLRNLVHLFRNSIDHGVESPEERAAAEKPLEANLQLNVTTTPEQIKLELSDDGRGIDYEALEAKAKRLNILPEGTCPIAPEVLNDIIFMDGISSRETATVVSGKGVGLSALKAAVESIGGAIAVESQSGSGTTITIVLPRPNEVNDLTTPVEFMYGISETIHQLFTQQYELPIQLIKEVQDNQIVLDEMTAIVNIKGTMNLIIMMSVSRKLLYKLVPKLILYEISESEYADCEEDLLGELSNTVIGNSLRNFNHSEDIFHLGIPVIMSHSEGYIKYSQDLITSRYFELEGMHLSMHLIPIHSEYIIKRLKED